MKRALRNVLTATVSTTVALAAAEAWVRHADPMGTRYLDEYRAYRTQLRQDAVVYYRHAPGAALQGRDWTLAANADGLRGPALPPVKSAGTYRVVLLGDSVVLGWGVPWEQTVAHRLAPALARLRGGPVEVLADGVGSWNTVSEMRDLYARFARLDPDAVVVVYVSNDDEVKAEAPLEAQGVPVPPLPDPQFFDRVATARSVRTFVKLKRGGPAAPVDPAGRRATVEALRACRDLCRAAGIPFEVVSYAPYDDMRKHLAEAAKQLAIPWRDYADAFPASYLRSVANSRLDGHFDGRGHARLAERMAASLEKEVAGGEPRVARARAVSVRGAGEIPPEVEAFGLTVRGGLELPPQPAGAFAFLARVGAPLPAGAAVALHWDPADAALPSRLEAGTWAPLVVPGLAVPRRLTLEGLPGSAPRLHLTPVLSLSGVNPPRSP